MWLVILDVLRHRDADALVLAAWILGIFVFASLFNWSVNGRTLLPLAPATGILLTRAIDSYARSRPRFVSRAVPGTLIAAAAFAAVLNSVDFSLAAAAQRGAEGVASMARSDEARLWFQGHWGFQHYCQEFGGRPFVAGRSRLNDGDMIATPANQLLKTEIASIKGLTPVAAVRERVATGMCVMNMFSGAGFYSDLYGPLPFVFGPVTDERFLLHRVQE